MFLQVSNMTKMENQVYHFYNVSYNIFVVKLIL